MTADWTFEIELVVDLESEAKLCVMPNGPHRWEQVVPNALQADARATASPHGSGIYVHVSSKCRLWGVRQISLRPGKAEGCGMNY